MIGGYIVQVSNGCIEVLCLKTFARTWRRLEKPSEAVESDTIWWQSYRGYLTREGQFKDKCIGGCRPCNAYGRTSEIPS